jgi:hypothetical protein
LQGLPAKAQKAFILIHFFNRLRPVDNRNISSVLSYLKFAHLIMGLDLPLIITIPAKASL